MGYQVRFRPGLDRADRALSRYSEAIADVARAFPTPQVKASRVAAGFMAEESRRRETWKKIALNSRSPFDRVRARFDSDPEFHRRWKEMVSSRVTTNPLIQVRENTLRLGLGSDLTRFLPGAGVKRAVLSGSYSKFNASQPYAGKIQLWINRPQFKPQRSRPIPDGSEPEPVETILETEAAEVPDSLPAPKTTIRDAANGFREWAYTYRWELVFIGCEIAISIVIELTL